MKSLLSVLVFVSLFIGLSFASSGDRSADFQRCVTEFDSRHCSSSKLPLSLRITRWSCTDDSKYRCMHLLTDLAVTSGMRIHQYYGKWPFWRLLGMQEPASVAFSLLNLWFHARGARQVLKRLRKGHPMKRYYLVWAAVSVNAWIWSSVFHTRDLPFTEKMDYFSAALTILYALYYTVVRLFHLYPLSHRDRPLSSGSTSAPSTRYRTWSVLCILVYLSHISYLLWLPRFDYAYNMAFNVALGLTHNALWLLYALPKSMPLIRRFPSLPTTYRPAYAGRAALFVALTTAATALELFDFPPWRRIIDAHALWHLSTALILPFWYEFLIEDAQDEGWRGYRT